MPPSLRCTTRACTTKKEAALKTPYTAEERIAWDIYFASLCSMTMHPGNRALQITISDTAIVCDEMIEERRRRIACQPGSQEPQS